MLDVELGMVGIQCQFLHVKDLFRNVTNSRTIIVLFLWNISRISYPKTIGTLFSLLVTDIVLSTLHYEIMDQLILKPATHQHPGIEHVLEEKDLGIIIDSELTFEEHIEAKLGTANQMLGLIRRNLTCCTAEIVIPLYKAFVRQHLEFGVTVWGGFITRRQLHAIERVQMNLPS